MKKIFLVPVLFLMFAGISFSQPSTFLKMYNKGNSGFSVRELNGNTYVVAGGTDYYYNFHWFLMSPLNTTNIHLFKTATNGNLLWEKIFSSLNHRLTATWMETVNDGGLIVTGNMNNELVWPPDSNDIFLLKTDGNGNIAWAKTFDTGKDEIGFCVRQTSDNGFIISGFHDAVPTSLVGNTYALLIKTDNNGNILWNKKYQIPVRDLDTGEGLPVMVSQTVDGGYVVTGTTAASHAADLFIFRTDPAGNLLWAKSYDHDASVFRFSLGLDIIESQSGDLVVAGAMDKDQNLNQYNYPYILKVNNNGVFINAKMYSTVPDQLFQAGFSSVEQTPDGGFFFTGMGGYGGFGNQAQFIKTDDSFNTQWSRVYTMDGAATMGSRSARRTSDGCYVFTGKKQFSGTVLMKTDNLGLIPCKNPTGLVEIIPSVIVQDHFPSVISGINSSNLFLNTQISLTDTSTLCPNITTSLPVEFISFKVFPAGNNNSRLEWKTASEINSDHFIIEKSYDGLTFEESGKIKSVGNSTNTNTYYYFDTYLPESKVVYYRLSEIDFNGEQTFTSVIPFYIAVQNINIQNTSVDYRSKTIMAYLSTIPSGNIRFSLMDIAGKVVLSGSPSLQGNGTRIVFETGDLARGVYYLNLQFEGNSIGSKIFY